MESHIVSAFENDDKKRIRAQQGTYIHELALSSQIGGLILSTIMLYAMWGSINTSLLLSWFCVLNAISVLRFFHWRSVKNKLNDDAIMLLWLPRLQILLFLSGSTWGFAGWFFIQPDALLLNTTVMLFMLGIISGGLGGLSPHLPSYIIYALPAGLPLIIKLFLSIEDFHPVLPFAFLLFMLVNVMYARNIQNNILKIILLRFENNELVSKLIDKNTEAEKQTNIAKEANLSKSQFLAASSHDLAQPLHSLTLFLSALKAHPEPELQKEYLEKADQCANTMNDLFSALMDISKLNANIIKPDFTNFNSNDLIEPIALEFELKAQESNLIFEIEIENTPIKTDGIIFQRIIRNLLSNAVKHNSNCKRGIRSKIIDNSFLKIDIYDTGTGIQENQLDNIFKEYYQVNNPERDKNKGLGLGLAIVKRLATLLDFEIVVNSKLGSGTTFSISIPVLKEQELINAPKNLPPQKDLSTITIILIHDDKMIRDTTKAVIESWPSTVITAEDKQEERGKLLEANIIPDVIISDYRLRENKTGIEAIQKIQDEFNQNMPAIISTGETSTESTKTIKDFNVLLLHKPIDSKELKNSVSILF